MAEFRAPEEGTALTNRKAFLLGEAGIPPSALETFPGHDRNEPKTSEQFENKKRLARLPFPRLPPHVQVVRKRSSIYYYQQIGRGTKNAGPRVPLTEEQVADLLLDPADRPLTPRMEQCFKALYRSALYRSRDRKLPFSLTIRSIRAMYLQQEGKCAFSGMTLDFEKTKERRPFAPSLDRLDVQGGYTPENVRLVTLIANLARSDWGDDALLTFCAAALRNHGRKVYVPRAA